MHITVDRLGDQEWQTLRDVRLAALADAPSAFWATLDDESRWGPHEWARFLRAVDWFIARRDGRPVGLVGVMRGTADPPEPEVIGMWVRPLERRRGTAVLLLDAVCDFARAQAARSVVLWVTDGNEPARLLYARRGFRTTGERAPLPQGRAGVEERLRLALDSPGAGEGTSPGRVPPAPVSSGVPSSPWCRSGPAPAARTPRDRPR